VTDVQGIIATAFDVLGTERQIRPFSAGRPEFDLGEAYQVTAAVRQMREARGEKVLGRKIGFTNRTIWDEYGVSAPMWGFIYDRTVFELSDVGEGFSLTGLAEPRIEPEIMFQFASAPSPSMDERELLACIDWVAHGFELVQSIFPGWEFSLADTVAGYGLHGALLIGPRYPVASEIDGWYDRLTTCEIDLYRDGVHVDHGHVTNVLHGPLAALRHLIDVLDHDALNPPLAAGEIVTTGTLTRAFPVAPGQTWSTDLTCAPLSGISVHFS
jgi:2-oxo-3-hexenedioate decarboxylase